MLNDQWMMFGVLDASSGKPASDSSFCDEGCYGWAKGCFGCILCCNVLTFRFFFLLGWYLQVYRGGSHTEGWGGYTADYKTGDTVELTLDCSSSQLSFAVQRTNSCWTLNLPQGKSWRLHLDLYYQNDQVRLLSSVLL